MENEWLKLNKKKIEGMQYQLTELAYKNENPAVPFVHYRGMIGACVVEIKKLQEKINALTSELSKKKE